MSVATMVPESKEPALKIPPSIDPDWRDVSTRIRREAICRPTIPLACWMGECVKLSVRIPGEARKRLVN